MVNKALSNLNNIFAPEILKMNLRCIRKALIANNEPFNVDPKLIKFDDFTNILCLI